MNKYRGFEILWFEEDDSFDVVKIDEPLLLCKNMPTVEDCLRKIDEYWGDDDGSFGGMKFKKASILFDDDHPIYFTEDSPPNYLTSKEYNWWWEGYIKKLAVGEYIDSDFHRYTRVE